MDPGLIELIGTGAVLKDSFLDTVSGDSSYARYTVPIGASYTVRVNDQNTTSGKFILRAYSTSQYFPADFREVEVNSPYGLMSESINLSLIVSTFLSVPGDTNYRRFADLTGDGQVDAGDMLPLGEARYQYTFSRPLDVNYQVTNANLDAPDDYSTTLDSANIRFMDNSNFATIEIFNSDSILVGSGLSRPGANTDISIALKAGSNEFTAVVKGPIGQQHTLTLTITRS